jgi:hypothetical protein
MKLLPLKFCDVVVVALCVFLLSCAITSSGCAFLRGDSTSQQKAGDVRNLCYAAASVGTQEALLQEPSWRPRFESAALDLDILLANKTVTGILLRQVVAQLPVKELKSPQAKVAIDAATMLFDSTAGTSVNIESQPYLVAAATGLRDGMKAALSVK